MTCFVYSFFLWQTLGLLPLFTAQDAMNIDGCIHFPISVPLDIYSEVKLWVHMLILCLVFWDSNSAPYGGHTILYAYFQGTEVLISLYL